MNIIDLRSDTVTQPTPEMREVMARAEVGDDVYGEDPTVNRLQELVAELVGMEKSLFVSSGTMANLIAIMVHCNRGHEMIVGNKSHVYLDEGGGYAALGGVLPFPLQNQIDGTLDLEDIRSSIWSDTDPHHSQTKLITLENTQNNCGGVVLEKSYLDAVSQIASEHNLLFHLDGARIFNASVKLGVDVKELTKQADSMMFCLSKGLCAPIGSMLCGTKEFIFQANRIRKQLGGGTRQAGIIAAAGIYALENLIDRLGEDHERAKKLGQGIGKIGGLKMTPGAPETNMIFFSIDENIQWSAEELAEEAAREGVKIDAPGPRLIRMVTHYWIDDEMINQAVQVLDKVISQG